MSALLTVRAAAERLGVAYSTLKQWIYDGSVRTVRTRGGHHRLTELEVQRLLLSGSVEPPPPASLRPGLRARGLAHGSSRSVTSTSSAARGPSASSAARDSSVASAPSAALVSSTPSTLVAISGRNQLRGIVEEVRGDGLLVQVRLRIGDQRLTAIITQDAVSELKLKRGDEAVAVIKSTEVMIGREAPTLPPRRRSKPKR
jgi:molybdopterin-binding protein